jgi:uncharacterized protein (DUF2235 family)
MLSRKIHAAHPALTLRKKVPLMAKNIVICCYGTGNEFGRQNSNVVKLYKMLTCNLDQVAYYHPAWGRWARGTRSLE